MPSRALKAACAAGVPGAPDDLHAELYAQRASAFNDWNEIALS